MSELTVSEWFAIVTLWTLAVALVVDLVWTRRHRVRANRAEAENRRLIARIEQLEQRSVIHTPRALSPAEVEQLERAWHRRKGQHPTVVHGAPPCPVRGCDLPGHGARPLRVVGGEDDA